MKRGRHPRQGADLFFFQRNASAALGSRKRRDLSVPLFHEGFMQHMLGIVESKGVLTARDDPIAVHHFTCWQVTHLDGRFRS